MRFGRLRESLRSTIVASAAAFCAVGACVVLPSATENAVANGDTRTLHLFHTHTGETIDATFRVDGHYDPAVLRQLNHFLRDWRNDDEHEMDPRLFDAVWEAYRTAGATDRIQIYSAYRSPETNAMLRRRSRAVAEHSQHMLGKAMDTTMPGFPMERIREAGMKLERGGVGWYPSANFVHLDVGGVRSWPRMSYDQLAGLFPDGKTVHIASNGQTLPGYEAARTELAERGDIDLPPSQSSGGFFAWLFGGGSTAGAAHEDEEDRRTTAVASAAPPAAPVQAQEAQPAPTPQPALAYAGTDPATNTVALDSKTPDINPRDTETASADVGEPMDLGGVLPLPPRRPADLASTASDIPLPPVRPNSLARVEMASIRFTDAQTGSVGPDPIGGLITSTASGVPTLRKAALPPIITEGTRWTSDRHATTEALAFAEDGRPDSDQRAIPKPVARPGGLVKPIGLRTASRVARQHEVPPDPVVATLAEPSGGPQLTGLRKAARLRIEKASL